MDKRFYDSQKLKLLRTARRESLAQVAKAVNIDRQNIWRAESGKGASITILSSLCDYYGATLHDVIYPRPAIAEKIVTM